METGLDEVVKVREILVRSCAAAVVVGLASASSLSFDVEAAKNRPVSKVIILLKDMLKQLEHEAEQDEEIYDKMACCSATLGHTFKRFF